MTGAFRVHKLGAGVLRWPLDDVPEDESDDVPFVWAQSVGLMAEGNQWVDFTSAPIGTAVVLCATVTALRGPVLREDPHRQITASRPYVGETVTLATGVLFACNAFDGPATGVGVLPLIPLEGAVDWLDRALLYRVHNHLIDLRAIEHRPNGRTPRRRIPNPRR